MSGPFRAGAFMVSLAACSLTATAGAQSSGRLAGVVLTTDDTPQPVRRALVTLNDKTRSRDVHTISDDRGAFAFSDLPAGSYTLQAARASFVSIPYGAPRPGGTGATIVLAAGQTMADVSVQLARGAVITGTVRNEQAIPLPGLSVVICSSDGRPLPAPANQSVNTDSHGVFRIFGLAAGSYTVKADNGSPVTISVASDAEVEFALRQLQQSRGAAPPLLAAPALVGAARPTETSQPPARTARNVSVYFPSAFSADQAGVITVGTGEEKRGVDITMRLMPAGGR